MTLISDKKAVARKAAFARRKQAHGPEASAAACASLLDVLSDQRGKTIAGYWPIHSEVDPRAALRDLAQDSAVVLPVIEGKGMPLSFRHWWPGSEMITGAFGAMIPEAGKMLVPDVVIVPLVAFDKGLFRLGYGGGFYDRTLAGLRSRRTVQAIGFAYSAQMVERLPIEETDEPLDMLVTEAGMLRPPPDDT
ncbi:MAG: 5-formyltetrahydrofolate cyclo-ligase [Pseudomonadota bacterium]